MNAIGRTGAQLQSEVCSYLVSEPCPGVTLGPRGPAPSGEHGVTRPSLPPRAPRESEGSAARPLRPRQNSHLPALPQETHAPELLKTLKRQQKPLKRQQKPPLEKRFGDATLHVLGESRDGALCSAPTGAAQGPPSAAPAAFPTVPRRARPGAVS